MYSSTLPLTSTRDGWWMFNATTPGMNGTHRTGGWVGLGAGLNRQGKSLISTGFEPRTVQPVVSRYIDHGRYKELYVLCSVHCGVIM
jgi:hypothetical protein